jgi:protease I
VNFLENQSMGILSGKKIAFLIAPQDFRDEEYFQPKVVLQSQGATVTTSAKGDPEEITGSKGGKARTDALMAEVTPDTYAALVFVGGPGAKVYLRDKEIHKLIQDFQAADKVIGAICYAPAMLAAAGILKGKKVTAFSEQKEFILAQGALWSDQPVVVDGAIVTAQSADTAIQFGEELATVLAPR